MDESNPSISQYRPSAQAGTLEAAVAYLRRGLRADGSYEGVSEWETVEHQWGLFDAWCSERGLIVPASFGPDRKGGREHDVRFDDAFRRWIKYTKPNHAGFAVEIAGQEALMLPAKPLQYLERWKAANTVFGDDVELLGLLRSAKGISIVISQRDLTGDSPTWEDVETLFVQQWEMTELARRNSWEAIPPNPSSAGVSEYSTFGL